MSRAESLHHHRLFHDDIGAINTDLANYQAVTVEDIKAVARKYLTPANRTVIGFSMGRSPAGRLDHTKAWSELLPLVAKGQARLVVDQVLPMSQAAKAHQHLASRGTRGKVILTP